MKVIGQPDGLECADILAHDSRFVPRVDSRRMTLDGRSYLQLYAEGWTRGDIRAAVAQARSEDRERVVEHWRQIGAIHP